MTSLDDVVVLLDCDNTLLDNDRVQVDLRDHLAHEFGVESRDRYWAILEQMRAELGYVDYLGAPQRSQDETTLAARLQREGAESFDRSWHDLLECIATTSAKLAQGGHVSAGRA